MLSLVLAGLFAWTRKPSPSAPTVIYRPVSSAHSRLAGRMCFDPEFDIKPIPELVGSDFGPQGSINLGWVAVGDYSEDIATALFSILRHASESDVFVVHLVVRPEEPFEVAKLKRVLPRCVGLLYRLWDHALIEAMPNYNRMVKEMFGPDLLPVVANARVNELAEKNRAYMIKPFLHQLFPVEVERIVVLDSDLRLLADIRGLYDEEHVLMRKKGQVLGLAYELQPEYLRYGPYQGFNGGVQLMDLAAMRESEAYNHFINTITWDATTWPGNEVAVIADQSLFSLLNITLPGLVATLPCQWNFNLCRGQQKQGAPLALQYPWIGSGQCPPPYKIVHPNGGLGRALNFSTASDEELARAAEAFFKGSLVLESSTGTGC